MGVGCSPGVSVMLGERNAVQGIEAIGARITQIEDRIAAFTAGGPAALDAPAAARAATPAAAAAGAGQDLAFQGRLQAAMTQLGGLTGQDPATLAGGGLLGALDGALGGAAGLPGMTGLGGTPGAPGMAGLPGPGALDSSAGAALAALGAGGVDALTMAQRLGLDRSALAQSRIPSVAALAAPGTAGAAGAAPAAAPAAAGARNAAGVPADLAVYGNGKVPRAALTELSSAPGHRLWAPAAGAFERMRAAAAADGVSFGITDSYRPLGVQQELARTKGLYKNGGLAAVPGTSQHGWGTAVDLKLNSEALSWMRANAARFGFVADTPRESWHWVYQGT